jgi:hypothetical protein
MGPCRPPWSAAFRHAIGNGAANDAAQEHAARHPRPDACLMWMFDIEVSDVVKVLSLAAAVLLLWPTVPRYEIAAASAGAGGQMTVSGVLRTTGHDRASATSA